MPPSALTWKALKPYTSWPVDNSKTAGQWTSHWEAVFLNMIEALFAPGRPYLDGSTRTPGSGVAWTATRQNSNSLTLSPVSGPGKVPQLVHMTGLYGTSGVSGAPSLPYAFGETNSPSYGKVVSSLVLNPGSYAGNTATPFGASARYSGYYVCSPVDTNGLGGASVLTGLMQYGTTSNYSSAQRSLAFRAWESQDAVLIHIFCPEVGFGSLLLYGGWLKPDPSVATASDAESDGLIYGVSSSGNMGYSGARALDIHNGGGFLSNTSDSSKTWPFAQSHTGILVPGGGFSTLSRFGAYGSSLPTLVTSSQKLIKFPMYFVTNSAFIGMAREMWMFRESVNGLVLRSGGSGGTDVGWIASAHNSTASDAILLSI